MCDRNADAVSHPYGFKWQRGGEDSVMRFWFNGDVNTYVGSCCNDCVGGLVRA